jgi:hypothetical protein
MATATRTVRNAHEAKRNAQKKSRLQQAASLAAEQLPGLIRSLAGIRMLAEKEPAWFARPAVESALENTAQILQTWGIQPSKEKLENVIRDLRTISEEGRRKWQLYVTSCNSGVINVLAILQKIAPHDAELASHIQSLTRFEQKWPVTDAVWNQYKAQLESARQKLSHLNTNTTIQDFLIKVSRNQATIEDLNNDVLTWLKQHQMSSNLMITIR